MKTRAERYRATRSHFPTKPAREVLDAVRRRAPWVKEFRKWTRPYNPPSEGGAVRWIENTSEVGLRFIGYADEIAGLRHRGWYIDPFSYDDEDTLRGAVWQLPARHGRAQYVAGYVDPMNEGAARIDFDVIEGERGGCDYDHEDAAREAARCADSLAERTAEDEREYRLADAAKQRADELREEANEMRAELCDRIRETRARIAELREEAAEVEECPSALLY